MAFFKKKPPPPPRIAAVVVAAGAANRMGGIDKQFVPLGGVPVVARSIAMFEDSPWITEIVVVCRREQIPDYYRLVQDYAFEKVATVAAGGSTRQESVFSGVEACSDAAAFYAIHDGARPLVSHWEIEQCIQAAMACGAAATGTPVKDTIKVVGEDGLIQSTPNRRQLAAVATPQVFAADRYRQAMQHARKTRCSYTDDCQLLEQQGYPVAVSPGSYENIKITTPEDLVLAKAILLYREQGVEACLEYE